MKSFCFQIVTFLFIISGCLISCGDKHDNPDITKESLEVIAPSPPEIDYPSDIHHDNNVSDSPLPSKNLFAKILGCILSAIGLLCLFAVGSPTNWRGFKEKKKAFLIECMGVLIGVIGIHLFKNQSFKILIDDIIQFIKDFHF